MSERVGERVGEPVRVAVRPRGELEGQVLAELRRIAAEELDFPGAIEPHHELLKDLQLDSLGLTVVAVGLENHFRVRLSDEDAGRVRTVGDLVRLVAERAAS